MDIQEYIASGIIEAYVLGIASDEEVRELEQLSAGHPEIAAAIDDCRATMEQLSSLHETPPPPGLKDKIWAALEEESAPNAADEMPARDTPGRTMPFTAPANAGSKWRVPAAAAAILLIGSLALNFIFWNRSRSMEQEMASMKENQEQMLAANESARQQLDQAQQQFRLLLDPAVKTVALAGVGEHTDNSAMVLWDSRSKEVYLSLKNMPPPPAGKQYQLWAIVDGKPVDAGVYALQQKEAVQKMKVIPQAQMFAITLEQEGGSPSPTLEAMYVAGKV